MHMCAKEVLGRARLELLSPGSSSAAEPQQSLSLQTSGPAAEEHRGLSIHCYRSISAGCFENKLFFCCLLLFFTAVPHFVAFSYVYADIESLYTDTQVKRKCVPYTVIKYKT